MSKIQLWSGREFDPMWPTPDSFTIADIANGLSKTARFGGQGLVDYTVAQHCVVGARLLRKNGLLKAARYFLFHESEEGLGLGDMPTPIKYLDEMESYRILGKTVQYAAYKKVGLLGKPPKEVKELDNRMACAEAKVLLRFPPEWATECDTDDIIIKPYKSNKEARKQFLKEYATLFPNGIDINA